MPELEALRVKLFADGADLAAIAQLAAKPYIAGFTTNPTLMRKAGVTDYAAFAQAVLPIVTGRPISFEVFSDDWAEMERQALEIASWGENIYVKVPVTNTQGEFSGPLIRRLSGAGVKLNVTAVMTPGQVADVAACLAMKTPSCVSVFAGRIADTGVDPIPAMRESAKILKGLPKCELLWASSREVLNVIQAQECGCHIITVTGDILKKLGSMLGRDLNDVSLDTVKTFFEDSTKAGFSI